VIITRAPFRISFGGGGSDIPVYYRHKRGAVLSATINNYVYIAIHPYFNYRQTQLKYSKAELVDEVGEIKHPLFREALREVLPDGGVEIVSTADIPSGTGLGSSSTFTVALYYALYTYKEQFCTKEELARKACELEITRLGEPIGKQDQYAAAFGGLTFYEFNPDETVQVTPVVLHHETLMELEKSLLIFYLGDQRDTKTILEDQVKQVGGDEHKRDAQSKIVDLAYKMRECLVAGDLNAFASALDESWMLKRGLSARITNSYIDKYYERGREYGALGGKLLGAGGGGFLLMFCPPEDQDSLRKALFDLHELPFRFDWGGAQIVHVGERHKRQGFFTRRKMHAKKDAPANQ
jgi:D-glycero-alpha-D-manno-heptose-7-phosphate kinase